MKKNVFVFGIIAGAISSILMVITVGLCLNSTMSFDYGMLYGYAAMLIAFSMIFVCVKNYRDKYNGGFVSFGKAFRIGLYITLIASTIYVLVWLIDYYFFIPDFAERYGAYMAEHAKSSGFTQVELDKQAVHIAEYMNVVKNPFMHALFTYTEILPIGLVVSLIAAAILKRKPKAAIA